MVGEAATDEEHEERMRQSRDQKESPLGVGSCFGKIIQLIIPGDFKRSDSGELQARSQG
jgi:hypothetical protein